MIKIVFNFFKRKKEKVENTSDADITFALWSNGNIGVIANWRDETDVSAKKVGELFSIFSTNIASQMIIGFLLECQGDDTIDKQFIKNAIKAWEEIDASYKQIPTDIENEPIVTPSDVFKNK